MTFKATAALASLLLSSAAFAAGPHIAVPPQQPAPAPAATAAPVMTEAPVNQVEPGGPTFTPEAFRAHVAFLSDDLLEGRDTGSRGHEIAARYVSTHFESLGLKPGGEGGSWYQQVPFLEYRLSDTPGSVTIGGRRYVHRQEALLSAFPFEGQQSVEAPVVFVGYGLDAPELGYDDYRGLDVKGKVVVVLPGTPTGAASDVRAHLNSDKRRMAAKRGAVGMITLRTLADMKDRPWSKVIEGTNGRSFTWIGKDDQPYSAAAGLRFAATLDMPALEALFAGARRSVTQVLTEAARDGARPKGFALKPKVRFEQENTTRRIVSPNVLGVLPGSDPALAGEYILLMAHLDHIGISERGEDRINNGALDNATGIATMLEVARAIATQPNRPRRPILFAAVTAEERGLLGAQYLARNPVVPGNVSGVVNLDMPILLYDFTDVIAFGAEHSTLGPIVARAGQRMGIGLTADPLPKEGLFTRSDHYRFVQEGIPSVFLMTGFSNGGGEKFTGFLATNYHKPGDEITQPIKWNAGAKFARINYLIARELADAPEAPRWYSDSFFGRTLAKEKPKAARPAP
jgi:hypothetical protein